MGTTLKRYVAFALVAATAAAAQTVPVQPAPVRDASAAAERVPLPPLAVVEKRLAERFAKLAEAGFDGIVIVNIGGRDVLRGAAGIADSSSRRPFTPDTPVLINSLTKPITAAAILKLQDRKLLSVQDPVSKYFPDAPAAIGAITIHQLLTHSSGLPAYLPSPIADADLEPIGRAQFLQRLFAQPLAFRPGADFLYSNPGYSLLAAIIEQASGQPYESFVRAQVLTPAGISRIGYRGSFDEAKAARSRDGRTIAATSWGEGGPYWVLIGNGGMVADGLEFVRWRRAFAAGRVVSPAAVRSAGTIWIPRQPNAGEGYGWIVSETPARGHVELAAGGNAYFTSEMRYYRDHDMVIFAATNGLKPAGSAASALVRAIFGEPDQPEPAGNPQEVALATSFAEALQNPDAAIRAAFVARNSGPRFTESLGLEEIGRRFDALHAALEGSELIGFERGGPARILIKFKSANSQKLVALILGGSPDAPKVAGFEMQ